MPLEISFYTLLLLFDLWYPMSIFTSPPKEHNTLLICTKLGETIPLLYVYFESQTQIEALATRI